MASHQLCSFLSATEEGVRQLQRAAAPNQREEGENKGGGPAGKKTCLHLQGLFSLLLWLLTQVIALCRIWRRRRRSSGIRGDYYTVKCFVVSFMTWLVLYSSPPGTRRRRCPLALRLRVRWVALRTACWSSAPRRSRKSKGSSFRRRNYH